MQTPRYLAHIHQSQQVKQIALFVLIGLFCYILSLVLLYGSVEWLGIEVNLANLITSLIVIYITYLLNMHFVFGKGKYGRAKEVALFFLFSITGLLLNILLMYLMTTYLPLSYLLDKTIIVGLLAVFNFLSRKYIVFKT